MGGTAFQMSPAGSLFYDFYGLNAFKADVSISMPELGSLLDHRVRTRGRGAHRPYFQRRSLLHRHQRHLHRQQDCRHVPAPAGSTVLVDRNCHKSLTHLMMMNDVTPLYFRPTRNAYGILGGIPGANSAATP